MSNKSVQRMLDLYAGEGGSAWGYHLAGFADITGVDHRPMINYPFKFIMDDALTYLKEHGREYDVIHASPPCQDHSALASLAGEHGTGHLLADTREILQSLGKPYVIENVETAISMYQYNPIMLCGSMFDLEVQCQDGQVRQLRRHRLFESNLPLTEPSPCRHQGKAIGVYGNGGGHKDYGKGFKGTAAEARLAMGVSWMTIRTLSQAIPPAYTEWVGKLILSMLQSA